MKKVILFLMLLPYLATGQIIDSFESGLSVNWVQSNPGRWSADSISALSGRLSLHHVFDNTESGVDRIGIPLLNLHAAEGSTRWSFRIRHGYDPSSSNNWSVFLMSNSPPSGMLPDGTVKGYAIGVNLTGYDDTLRLWKSTGSGLLPVVNCRINWQTEIGVSSGVVLDIERSAAGHWTVKVFRNDLSLIRSSEGNDSEIEVTSWFGILYRYSSTRDRLLWIDDISVNGTFYCDSIAPSVKGFKICGRNRLSLYLDEKPDSAFLKPVNFTLNGTEIKPVSVVQSDEAGYILTFKDDFVNKDNNRLTINSICDKYRNCRSNVILEFTPVWAETADVIISEIMADPLPAVALPEKEYLEITNRSEYSLNLKNWSLSSGIQNVLLPEILLAPLERRILCLSQDTVLFKKYGKVTGLKQFPSLNDEGKTIWLTDSLGVFIHGVEYSSDWYCDVLKSEGGWSLEMKDIRFPFSYEGNWTASSSRIGGSPGVVNSVSSENPDTSFYGIMNVFPEDSNRISVRFSEPVVSLADSISEVMINGLPLIEILPRDPLFREFTLISQSPMAQKEVYKLVCSGNIKDFAGNIIKRGDFEFGITEPASENDILFNELLFNPFPGEPDYIEFYNNSDKIIDVSCLQLVAVDDVTGVPSGLIKVTQEKRCFMPWSYYAITTDRKKISDRYSSGENDKIFEIAALPSMPDDRGHLLLYNRELDKIDEVFYNDSLHNSELADNEGVALGKISPENQSEAAQNWKSASENTGWGTPGSLNFEKDTLGPDIIGFTISGRNSVKIELSEEPAADFLSLTNCSLNEEKTHPVSVIKESGLIFRFMFEKFLKNKNVNYLTISKLCDKSGNCSGDTVLDFTPVWAETGDIIITELMADPVPAVSLPAVEYLEIKNRSQFPLNLENWQLVSGGQFTFFPGVTMQPGEMRIITSVQDTISFKDTGKVTGLRQFPALTDEGKMLCLYDTSGLLIHGIEYSDDWFGSELKSQGGWSLELIDDSFPFYYEGNWTASVSGKGGTPGYANSVSSVNRDMDFFGLVNVFPVENSLLKLTFSEPVSNFENLRETRIDYGLHVESISATDPLYREFTVKLSSGLVSKQPYTLELPEAVTDFAGNIASNIIFTFGFPESASAGDITFSELLFNPFPGDPDYIEFYNCSGRIIDASELMLASVSPATSDTSDLVMVSTAKRCIMPGTYYAITTDRQMVLDRYPSSKEDRIFEVPALPSMPDDIGSLLLFNKRLEMIDYVLYNEKMHYSLLSANEGVSLEKNEQCRQSTDPVSWHSAVESYGWGTPGATNSIAGEINNEAGIITLSSTKITPDADGFEDFLQINFAPGGQGTVLSVDVFDERGNHVRKVAGNLLTGAMTDLIWDGTADDGTPLQTGIYVIMITWFDEKGATGKMKKVCSVIR